MFGNRHRSSSGDYWHLVIPFLAYIREGTIEKVVVPLRRPSLHTVVFFLGLQNLLRGGLVMYDVQLPLGGVVAAQGIVLALALVAGELVEILAKGDRTGRALAGVVGLTGFGLTAVGTSSGLTLQAQLYTAGLVVILTATGEIGYLFAARARRRGQAPTGQSEEA
jgi:hypothetical protein